MYKCPRCGTEYRHGPAECDWCPEVQTYEMPRVFVRRAVAAAAVGMLLGLAACGNTAVIQPGSEVKAIFACKDYGGVNVMRTSATWRQGESILTVDCRDGTHLVFYFPKRTR